ncbi:MAG: hypothetical protein WCI67_18110 [Chloroflexales bacterium]
MIDPTEPSGAGRTPNDFPLVIPIEQLPITLFDAVVLAIRLADGRIYLSVSEMSGIIDSLPESQLRRIRRNEILAPGLVRAAITTPSGRREDYFLPLDLFSVWLLGVTPKKTKVKEHIRQRIAHLRSYLVAEVSAAFNRLMGFPQGSSREIEDLRDLDHIDHVVSNTELLAEQVRELNERQRDLDAGMNRARQAWRDLDARLRAVENRTTEPITDAQRGYIYMLVQAWGKARAEREPESKRNPYASCWASLKVRFRLSRYEDLPLSEYASAVAFVRAAYRQLTGEDLDIPEQTSLDL